MAIRQRRFSTKMKLAKDIELYQKTPKEENVTTPVSEIIQRMRHIDKLAAQDANNCLRKYHPNEI